jgi:hypothetical protein
MQAPYPQVELDKIDTLDEKIRSELAALADKDAALRAALAEYAKVLGEGVTERAYVRHGYRSLTLSAGKRKLRGEVGGQLAGWHRRLKQSGAQYSCSIAE